MIKQKTQIILLVLTLIISCLFSLVATPQMVFASSIDISGGYTNVMEDLQKDSDFDASDYPVIEDDYSLQVLSISESNKNELFLYVYQPSGSFKNFVASYVNMAVGEHSVDFKIYELTLLNNSGVFYKYLVKNFVVDNASTRAYNIASIMRPFDETIDESIEDETGNIITQVPYKVARIFSITSENGESQLSCYDTDVIEVVDKYVGFVRYETGANFWGTTDSIDSHFVAFSTDLPIDKLLEADVYYKYQSVHYQENGQMYQFGTIEETYSYLKEGQTVFYGSDKGFWYNYEYTKDRIQTVEDFIAGENFSTVYKGALFNVEAIYTMDEQAQIEIQSQDWILRFADTTYTFTPGWYGGTKDYTVVSNVSIVRLKFEYDGKVYNLGVVDNMQTGSGEPVNNVDMKMTMADWFKIVLAVLAIILLVVIIWPILPTVFNILWAIIKIVFKAIWWVICLPFKLIAKLFKKRSD